MVMGASAVLVGEVGSGNTTKLANQIIVACNIAALGEALVLAKKAGVDPQKVFEAIRGGLAGSTVMEAKAPMMIAQNFKPGFRIDLHVKDLNNVVETAEKLGMPIECTDLALSMLKKLQAEGCGSIEPQCAGQGLRRGRGSDAVSFRNTKTVVLKAAVFLFGRKNFRVKKGFAQRVFCVCAPRSVAPSDKRSPLPIRTVLPYNKENTARKTSQRKKP